SLTDVGTVMARVLYHEAGGTDDLENITANPQMVSRMLYTFLVEQNNSWSRSILSTDAQHIMGKMDMMFYVSASLHKVNKPTVFVQHILANVTGTATNLTEEECRNADKRPEQDRDLYEFLWIQGWELENATEPKAYCLRSSVWLSKAVSPAFELKDWASTEYSTWTESRWKGFSARIFLVASRKLEPVVKASIRSDLVVRRVMIATELPTNGC
ncbi:hypothetical protein scyTo_0024538, partial [Scyliorhinus torazame]|nr:hypothetical protein [Scyliorhinus torazame]